MRLELSLVRVCTSSLLTITPPEVPIYIVKVMLAALVDGDPKAPNVIF